jgi:hypothetical protein
MLVAWSRSAETDRRPYPGSDTDEALFLVDVVGDDHRDEAERRSWQHAADSLRLRSALVGLRNTVARDGMPWPDEDTDRLFLRESEENRI